MPGEYILITRKANLNVNALAWSEEASTRRASFTLLRRKRK